MENQLLVALGHTKPIFWYCDDKKRNRIPYETDHPDLEWAKNESMGVFFVVNALGDLKNEKGNLRHEKNVLRPLAMWADFDMGTFEEQIEKISHSPTEPSAFVKSGHGYHVYWFLNGTEQNDLSRWSRLQKSIADFFGSDPAVIDSSRIMRLPNSWHCKDEIVKRVILEKCNSELRYSLDEIETEFPIKPNAIREVEKLLITQTSTGGRNVAATKVLGALLHRFKPTEWETYAWPMAKSWNQKSCSPPDDEYILRNTFDSLCKKEMDKRSAQNLGVVTFQEDELEPEIEEMGDRLIIRQKTNDGIAEFEFNELEQSKNREIDCTLVVQLLIPGSAPKPFSGRLNVLSMSAKEGFARSLAKSFGKEMPWDLMLARATESIREHLSNQDRSLWIEEATKEDSGHLFHPFIVKGGANVIFGKGGSGKTYIALRLALSYVTKLSFLAEEYIPEEMGKVLFVDYEATAGELQDRIYRICSGTNFNPDLTQIFSRIRYFNPEGALPDCLPAIKKIIKTHNISLVIIDSAVQACGGEPERAEVASRYFNALRSLNVTSLTIAHETKLENHAYPFGSVFFWNAPRNIWNVQCESEDDDRIKQIGLFHRKNNNGPLHKPLAVKIFHGDGFSDIGFGELDLWEKEMSLGQRILRLFKNQSRITKGDMVALLKAEKDSVDKAVQRLKNKGKIMLFDETNGIWGVPLGDDTFRTASKVSPSLQVKGFV